MGLLNIHTSRIILAFVIAVIASGGRLLHAQELVMPDRWSRQLSDICPIYPQDTLTIRILGDIMMHEKQISSAKAADGTYNFSSYFMLIKDKIRNADLAVANMEFTLAGEPYTGYPCFSAPDAFAEYLEECGFDIFLAANNHIFDKGRQGALRTLEIYREMARKHGIRFTGLAGSDEELSSNNPLMVRRKGILIAILNFTYGTNSGLREEWPQTNYIGDRIKLGRAFSAAEENDADFIIAFPHWGTEYDLMHSERQEKEAQWLAANGADWIIGAHPHVVQDSSTVNGVPTAYSLGNAVSNMSASNTQLELMATIRIVREGNGDTKALPLELKYLWCSRPGGFNDSYTVVPVEEFIGREEEWYNKADYHKMVATYEKVKKETKINEQEKHHIGSN